MNYIIFAVLIEGLLGVLISGDTIVTAESSSPSQPLKARMTIIKDDKGSTLFQCLECKYNTIQCFRMTVHIQRAHGTYKKRAHTKSNKSYIMRTRKD